MELKVPSPLLDILPKWRNQIKVPKKKKRQFIGGWPIV